jgi:hypothetical protein
MSAQNIFSAIMHVAGLVNELDAAGVRVEVGDDFSKYRRYRSGQSDRDAMYPMFDVASSYIDASNGFWVCGFGPDGELIHTQAVRLLNLSGVSLGEHLDTHRHKYITPDTTPDPDLTYYSGPNALAKITGSRVCYHGDFWLQSSGLGGMRSQGATSVFSRILFEIMQFCWKPEYVFALVPLPLAAKGAHLRYGYSHCEPGKWVGPDNQTTDVDYMVWMSAADIANALSREPQTLRNVDRVSSIRSALSAVDSKG